MKPAIFLLAACVAFTLNTHAQKPTVAKEAQWVTINKLDYTNTSLDRDAEDGYVDIDYEKQVSLADQAVYIRESSRIISESGVQNNSQVSVGFDPTYQQLVFHTIRIIRDGQIINKLDLEKIKTVHEETDLDNFIYNGTLNAILVLDDVRKGDIIEYSYTLKGFNPVFQNKYSTVMGTAGSSPLYNLYFSIVVPKGRTVDIKSYNENIQPQVTASPNQTLYVWQKTKLGPLHPQDHLPSWYNAYPEIRVSEYKSWKEVNDWAATLFPKKPALSPGLAAKIKEIQATHTTDEARTLAALRFVQDDIRYMGIEMGVHSHKPVSPNKVFEQRFGDCKEKSYLLCTMLQAMGIEANPVLISTENKKALFSYLPAAQNFDHTTVQAKVNGKYYWFDATITYQRGNLHDICYPDYQCGLVLTDTTTALTAIPANASSKEDIKEVFNIADMSGNAHLVVNTTYTGSYADAQRDEFKSNSNYDILKGLQKFYAFYFEKISADSLSYNDNDSTGIFTRTVYFTIKDIWSNEKGIKKGEFSPFIIGSLMKKPDDKIRTMPYSISYPANYHEEVEINLPEEWKADTTGVITSCAAFDFSMKCSLGYKQVRLVYDYKALQDYIQPKGADDYIAAVKKADDNDGFNLTYGTSVDKETIDKASASNAVYVILAVVVLIGAVVWWSQRG